MSEGKKISLASKIKNKFRKKEAIVTDDEQFYKLAELVESSRILFHAKTVFPFDFFPDDLIIDRDKIAIITQYFFASTRQQSILVRNISEAYVDISILFATLHITDKYFTRNSVHVEYLKKKDAIKARDIIQGLVICYEREVDISNMKRGELLPYLEEIGKAAAV